jgi:hypothetical protein
MDIRRNTGRSCSTGITLSIKYDVARTTATLGKHRDNVDSSYRIQS